MDSNNLKNKVSKGNEIQKKGYIVVISNTDFNCQCHSNIIGAEEFIEKIRNKYEYCEVFVHKNLSAIELLQSLRSLTTNEEIADFKYLCLIFISHFAKSEDGYYSLLTSNCLSVKLYFLTQIFNDEECPQLKSIQKDFYFFSCNSNEFIREFEKSDKISCDVLSTNVSLNCNVLRDTLVVYSTLDGFKSKRDPKLGSQLIKEFESRVHRRYNEEIISLLCDIQLQMESNKNPQIMEFRSYGFDKKFFLFPVDVDNKNESNLNCYRISDDRTIKRGLCIIMNNRFVRASLLNPFKSRDGATMDDKNLNRIFTEFNFEVILLQELSVEEMVEQVKNTIAKVSPDHEAFLVWLMSHGESISGRSVIEDVSGGILEVETILNMLSDTNAPQLKGKAKLVFINACRGDKIFENEIEDKFSDSTNITNFRKFDFYDSTSSRNEQRKSTSDLLIVRSTLANCASLRHISNGSLFVSSLCIELNNLHQKFAIDTGIISLLRKVSNSMKYSTQYKQCIEIQSVGFNKSFLMQNVNRNDPEWRDKDIYSQNPIENNRKRGFCIVFANYDFSLNPDSIICNNITDTSLLTSTFESFNFKAIIHLNKTAKEIRQELRGLKDCTELKTHDSLIIMFITRGGVYRGKDVVLGIDNSALTVDYIMECLNQKKLPKMSGKPKILIIDAPRGDSIINENNCSGSLYDYFYDLKKQLFTGFSEQKYSSTLFTPVAIITSSNTKTSQQLKYVTEDNELNSTNNCFKMIKDLMDDNMSRLIQCSPKPGLPSLRKLYQNNDCALILSTSSSNNKTLFKNCFCILVKDAKRAEKATRIESVKKIETKTAEHTNYNFIVNNFDYKTTQFKKRLNADEYIKDVPLFRSNNSQQKTLYFENLTSEEIINELISFVENKQLENVKSIFILISAHGGRCSENGKNCIYGVDGIPLLIEDLTSIFNDLNSPLLTKCEKEFYFRFCSGSKYLNDLNPDRSYIAFHHTVGERKETSAKLLKDIQVCISYENNYEVRMVGLPHVPRFLEIVGVSRCVLVVNNAKLESRTPDSLSTFDKQMFDNLHSLSETGRLLNDANESEMYRWIHETINRSDLENGIFIVIYGIGFKYGDRYILFDRDNNPIDFQTIIDHFNETDCPQLKDKLKRIWLSLFKTGLSMEQLIPILASLEADDIFTQNLVTLSDKNETKTTNTIRDTLVCWSTVNDHANARNLQHGSLFSHSLTQLTQMSKEWSSLVINRHLMCIGSILSFQDGKHLWFLSELILHDFQNLVFSNEYPKADEYKMSSKPRGFCCIFVNSRFENGFTSKFGTNVDIRNYRSTFEVLHFDVKVEVNLSAIEMLEVMNQMRKNENLSKHDCIIIIILSHSKRIAGRDVIYGSDGNCFHTEEMKQLFSDEMCPLLIGKPKVFLIDGPRGDYIIECRTKEQIGLCFKIEALLDTFAASVNSFSNCCIAIDTPFATFDYGNYSKYRTCVTIDGQNNIIKENVINGRRIGYKLICRSDALEEALPSSASCDFHAEIKDLKQIMDPSGDMYWETTDIETDESINPKMKFVFDEKIHRMPMGQLNSIQCLCDIDSV